MAVTVLAGPKTIATDMSVPEGEVAMVMSFFLENKKGLPKRAYGGAQRVPGKKKPPRIATGGCAGGLVAGRKKARWG